MRHQLQIDACLMNFIRCAAWHAAICGLIVVLHTRPAKCEQTAESAEGSGKPVLTGTVSSIDQVYDDFRFVFELAGDKKGFEAFKETIAVFLEGAETKKPAGWRVYATADGLHTVASLPIKDEAEFKKFLRNLWDLDMKTAPAPTPAMNSQVRRSVQEKLRSLKLHPNERIVFGLTDGFLRYESGYVHIGESIEDVRLAKGGISAQAAKGATLGLHIEGDAATPAQRRQAFDKTRQKQLHELKKPEDATEAQFALEKSMLELQLAKIELFFSDAAQLELGWTTSHDKKSSVLAAKMTPAKGTPLAKDIDQMGQLFDDFAGVSSHGVVMSSTINFPNDQTFTQAVKSVTRDTRSLVSDELEKDSRLSAEQKSVDRQFLDLVCNLVDDVAAMPVFNGFARTWANSDGSLTTVGAVKVADGAKYREMVQKFQSQERVGNNSGDKKVEIHKIKVSKWQKDIPELFEKEGAVYMGIADNAVWYALGEKSLERLEQAIQEAGGGQAKNPVAVDFHAELLPLAKVWDRFRSTHPASDNRKKPKKTDVTVTETRSAIETGKSAKGQTTGKRPVNDRQADGPNGGTREKDHPAADKEEKVARAKSTVNELELHHLAVQALQHGHDTFSITLKRVGENAELEVKSDEGLLRFLGMALSKFTKDNLADE